MKVRKEMKVFEKWIRNERRAYESVDEKRLS